MASPLLMELLRSWQQKRARGRMGAERDIQDIQFSRLGSILSGRREGQTQEELNPRLAERGLAGGLQPDKRTLLEKILNIPDPEARKAGLNILSRKEHMAATQAGRKSRTIKMHKPRGDGTHVSISVPSPEEGKWLDQGWKRGIPAGTKEKAPKEKAKVDMFRKSEEDEPGVFIKRKVKPEQVESMKGHGYEVGTPGGTKKKEPAQSDILHKMNTVSRVISRVKQTGGLDEMLFTMLANIDPDLAQDLRGGKEDREVIVKRLEFEMNMLSETLTPENKKKWLQISSQTTKELGGKSASDFITESLSK